MQDLTLVGLTEDRSKLVLVSDSGEKFTLPADAKLRAALRGDLARNGQLEIRMDSALRPRDIQARIRAGESPESVAEAAQTTLDRIMTYAGPVLAERAHIADRAQRASVRRRGGEGPARVLGDAVHEQLRSQNIDPGSVEWDSWRREDGRWTLMATVDDRESLRRAEFTFDVHGRYAVAEDDDARWLIGDAPVQRPRETFAPQGRRLSAVHAAVHADEPLSLGDDAIELVTGAEVADAGDATGPEERTVDLTQTARDLRGGTSSRVEELSTAGDADWMATQASDRPRVPRGDADPEPRPREPQRRQPHPPEEGPEQEQSAVVEEPQPEPADAAPKKAGRKGRRASVPSWDEIMFGGGRSE